MDFLDLRTVLVVEFFLNFVSAAVLFSLWLSNRKLFCGLGFWIASFGFQIFASLMLIFRGVISDFFSVVLANTAVIAGVWMVYIGLQCFVNKRSTQVQNYVLLAVFAVVHYYFTFYSPDLLARSINLVVFFAFFSFKCAWFAFYGVGPEFRKLTFGVGMTFVAYGLINIGRLISNVVNPTIAEDFFQVGFFDRFSIVAYLVLMIALVYNFILMVNKRLIFDLNEQQEKLKKTKEELEKNYGELKEMNNVMVGRELKMAELKEEVEKLKRGGKK